MNHPRRLGLLGGSFDPIHRGHLHVARTAQEAFDLDRVVFVPAARPPHKPGRRLAPGADRLAMVRLAIAGEPTWCASDLELRRPGPSYTIDTLRDLPAEVGELASVQVHLILGSDNLPGLVTWHGLVELLEGTHPVVVLRGGDPPGLPPALRAALPPELVARLEAGLVTLPPASGRSTDLRSALAREGGGGELTDLPPAVEEYIRSRGLYRSPGRGGEGTR